MMRLILFVAALAIVGWIGDVGRAQSKSAGKKSVPNLQKTITDAAGRKHTVMRKVTHAERKAAANQLKTKIAAEGATVGLTAAEALATAAINPPAPDANGAITGEYLVGANGQLVPDVSGLVPNYANSPIPDFVDSTCAALPSKCGIRKFVDSLPGLGPDGANNLGQYIPVAQPVGWPLGCVAEACTADYYEIELGEYAEKMHSDLPPTTLRGYRQTNIDSNQPFHYLGPLIVAQKGRPVRIKFTNRLPLNGNGNLFIPVDTTVMGAGAGPNVDDVTRMTTAGQQCTDTVKANCFSQNRATIHLHGGVTPWISDGTTHQWITPAGETTPYPKGVSVFNVPDMDFPGKPESELAKRDGVQTFYYTNDQSARLMFYHDHAHGITRLNVYAGEAAGYLVTDATEQALLAGPLAGLGYGIPLIVQDKTFVDARNIGYQDPTWNWGTGLASPYTDPKGNTTQLKAPSTGDLWWPHVYQPAQNPYDITGTNAMGRWVYGPWFWPPTNNIAFKEVANPYYDCDLYGMPVPPALSCRDWQPVTMPGTPHPSVTAEAFFDTPVINGTAYPYLNVPAGPVRFRVLNASHDRFWNLSLYVADESGFKTDAGFPTEVKLNAAEVAAAKDDPFGVFATPDPTVQTGPDWIYIGTEGGFLPMPVRVPAQVTTWVTDPTVFNAGNVDKHSLLLGPAERADVIVDFSAYAGKTLIVYNDAPAAFPARDPRFDYYTDSADLVDTGGIAPVLPGYGPNTRTVMQIRVGGTVGVPGTPFDYDALVAAFTPSNDPETGEQIPGVFEGSQDPVIVGQSAYNAAYGKTFPARYPCWGVARIQDTSMCVQPATGQPPLYIPLQPKAIHDEMGASFDDYGRMSTNLGLELPFTQVGNQNFILQAYSDPPTELVSLSAMAVAIGDPREDGTQIWKITHNGVDTHPVHFHLFHVQVINRVGWDGGIRLPHPTEIGWKDTVRISPLEDTIVALRPIAPTPDSLLWELPNSIRPLEPSLAPHSTLGFTNLDPQGNAVTITNELTNFGWEYIWHCHILSHEEHDMMRAIGFAVPPKTPALTGLISGTGKSRSVVLTWTDSLVATGFTVQKASDPAFTQDLVTINAGKVLTYTDRIGGTLMPIFYRVFASNTVGSSVVGYPTLTRESGYSVTYIANNNPPAAPTNLVATLQSGPQIRLTWTDVANNETAYVVERSTNGGAFSVLATLAADSNNYTHNGGTIFAGETYAYRVAAVNGIGTVYSDTVTIAMAAPNAPSNVTAVAVRSGGTARVTLNWLDNSNNETGFVIQRSTDPTFATFVEAGTVNSNVSTFTDTVGRGLTLYYRVLAENPFGQSAPTNATPFPIVTP
jgi:FtsP/CotA-like multicopper oxidase with cupredoxin domain